MTKAEEVRARDRATVSPAIYRYTDVVFAHGRGAELWDVDGRRYVDFAAGIATLNVGHSHPRVVAAVTDQAGRLMHGAAHIGYMEPYVQLAERLRAHAPAPLDGGKVLFVNSGSEAVEAALKLARMVTGRSMVMAFLGAFHGRPMGALGATASSATYRRGLAALLAGVVHVPYPIIDRPHGALSDPADVATDVWRTVAEMTLAKLVHPDDLAAIIVEPVLGEGGYFVPPSDFLPGLRELCDRTGALLIVDEVQTGLGRTGTWFGVDHWGTVPDIVVLGKALGGGLPLGGVLARASVMDRWASGSHGSTFGGNPVACRAGLESIAITEEDGLVDRAPIIGGRIVRRIVDSRLSSIGAVRGLGMMIAVEILDENGAPVTAPTMDGIVRRLGEAGLVTTKCGQSLLRIAPPLMISDALADEGVDILLETLRGDLRAGSARALVSASTS